MDTHGTSGPTHRGSKEVPCDFSVSSGEFRCSPTSYLKVKASSILPVISLLTGIPVAACLTAAFWDVRWALVAMMLIFIVIPMVVAYIYFSELLTTDAREALAPKLVEIDGGREIRIVYLKADEENQTPEPRILPWGKIDSITCHSKHLVVMSKELSHTLIVPLNALPATFDYINLCENGNNSCQPT